MKINLYKQSSFGLIHFQSDTHKILRRESSIQLRSMNVSNKGIVIFQGMQTNFGKIIEYNWCMENKLDQPKGKLESTTIKSLFIVEDYDEFASMVSSVLHCIPTNTRKRSIYFLKSSKNSVQPAFIEIKPFKFEQDKLYVIMFCTFIDSFLKDPRQALDSKAELIGLASKSMEIIAINNVEASKDIEYKELALAVLVPALKYKGFYEIACANEIVLKGEDEETDSVNKSPPWIVIRIDNSFTAFDVILSANLNGNIDLGEVKSLKLPSGLEYTVREKKVFLDISSIGAEKGSSKEELVSIASSTTLNTNQSLDMLTIESSEIKNTKYNAIYFLVVLFIICISIYITSY